MKFYKVKLLLLQDFSDTLCKHNGHEDHYNATFHKMLFPGLFKFWESLLTLNFMVIVF